MKNTVELVGHYGGDITHALSAWTSTNRDLTPEKIARIPTLLKTLAQNKPPHKSPFEKSTLHFLVDTDIATHIHIIKHRIGVSVNAESARYKELKEDKYYLPEDWDMKISDDSLDEIARFAGLDSMEGYREHFWDYTKPLYDTTWQDILRWYTEVGNKIYHVSLTELEKTLGRKRAKETARFFKTYNSQIAADVMFNWSSFAHFLSLRMKPEAQIEIKEIAEQMLQLVRNIEGNPFEHTLAAFNY